MIVRIWPSLPGCLSASVLREFLLLLDLLPFLPYLFIPSCAATNSYPLQTSSYFKLTVSFLLSWLTAPTSNVLFIAPTWLASSLTMQGSTAPIRPDEAPQATITAVRVIHIFWKEETPPQAGELGNTETCVSISVSYPPSCFSSALIFESAYHLAPSDPSRPADCLRLLLRF